MATGESRRVYTRIAGRFVSVSEGKHLAASLSPRYHSPSTLENSTHSVSAPRLNLPFVLFSTTGGIAAGRTATRRLLLIAWVFWATVR